MGSATSSPWVAGVGFKLASALCLTLMMACVKGLDGQVPAGQVVFVRALVTLAPLMVWLLWQGEARALCRWSSLRRHLGRGLSGTASMVAIFVSLACLPLSHAVLLGYATPLVTVLLARTVLRETVPAHRWAGALLGAAGVLVALAPAWLPAVVPAGSARSTAQMGTVHPPWLGLAAGLAGAVFAAVSTVQIRRLAASEPARNIVFHYTLTTAWLGACSALLGWVRPSLEQGLLMLGAGVFSGLGQWCVARSLRSADAAMTAPFEYTTLIWSVLIGVLLFGEHAGTSVALGGGLIVLSAGLVFRQELAGARRQAQAAASMRS
jgi:drug/metabolite transporter (DMT)-like permease